MHSCLTVSCDCAHESPCPRGFSCLCCFYPIFCLPGVPLSSPCARVVIIRDSAAGHIDLGVSTTRNSKVRLGSLAVSECNWHPEPATCDRAEQVLRWFHADPLSSCCKHQAPPSKGSHSASWCVSRETSRGQPFRLVNAQQLCCEWRHCVADPWYTDPPACKKLRLTTLQRLSDLRHVGSRLSCLSDPSAAHCW